MKTGVQLVARRLLKKQTFTSPREKGPKSDL
ncbi:hypothetical protein Y888_16990 [Mixta calida B021323]|jgi:hypothetical protein|nr:hypothetical protein Y888_16990 [Mixta calida B021323]